VPLMPSETLAIAMLCLRFSISQMDVPTRNAYVQGVVDPDERSAANGITNVVRSVGAATAPFLAGMLYSSPAYANYPWYIAGGLKIVYDLLLLYSMQATKPPEEVRKEVGLVHLARLREAEAGIPNSTTPLNPAK
jgi:MFS family permease